MEDHERYKLTKMKEGEEGEIVELYDGRGFQRKVGIMGIREGKKIRKITGHPLGGPVVVEVEGSGQTSMGYGMADKIIVDVYEAKQEP